MTNFHVIKDALQAQFELIKDLPLFYSNATKDELWDTYITSLTALGENEIYRERGAHDCQCCKHFIRKIGNLVAVKGGVLVSIWDIQPTNSYYDVTAQAMSKLVRDSGIRYGFKYEEDSCGTDSNLELLEDGTTHTWEHFYLDLPPTLVIKDGETRRKYLGNSQSNYASLKLTVTQLQLTAVEDVLDLIASDGLYKGPEFVATLKLMKKTLNEYTATPEESKDLWLWTKSTELGSLSTMRSTVIGSLIKDLSKGVPLEDAVKSFEAKIAPANYKRNTKVITKGMIKKAEEKVVTLGLQESLPRRHAAITDITVNNVLFSDKKAQAAMGGDIFAELLANTKDTIDVSKAEDITVQDFIDSVLPQVDSLEAYLDNGTSSSNAMSLMAPVNPEAPSMLKWGNNFTWTYNGDVTDSIKERVKSAGGSVTGALRISLGWDNADDLDIYMSCPKHGHICFSRRGDIRGHKILDVDMNNEKHNDVDPVENLTFPLKSDIADGTYVISVHNYSKRKQGNGGFTIELEYDGVIQQFTYDKHLPDNAKVTALEFTFKKGVLTVVDSLPSTSSSKEAWGLPTQKLHRVSAVMLSPNYWDGSSTGNKHFFFMLDGFKNPDSVRGFYNEFLREDLKENRKVFEVLGNRMKAPYSEDQLSGLGFSSTLRNNLVVKAVCRDGFGTRLLNIKF